MRATSDDALALYRAGVVRPRDLAALLGIPAHAASEHIHRWRKRGLIAATSPEVNVGDCEACGETILKPVSQIGGRPQRVHPECRYGRRSQESRSCPDCGTVFGPPRRGPWPERCRRCHDRRKWARDPHRRLPVALRRAVIARDGHRCGILPAARRPDPAAPATLLAEHRPRHPRRGRGRRLARQPPGGAPRLQPRQGRPAAGVARAGSGLTDVRTSRRPARGRHKAPVWRDIPAVAHGCHRT